jgi:MYXO-CTERM domain-containing protein
MATWGGWGDASFRWDETWGASSIDLDLYLYDVAGNLCGKSVEVQDGDDNPLESASCSDGGDWIFASIDNPDGKDISGLTGWLYTSNYLDDPEWSADMAGTLTLPGDTIHGVTVGAVDLPETDEVAYYSSRGPTEDGRTKPEIVAPASTSTSIYGPNGFPGTSCAAPHATGVAALLLGASKHGLTPDDLRVWMQDNTLDIEAAGVDERSGYGLLTPGEIPWEGCHCSTSKAPTGGGFAIGLLLALGLRRRR